MRQHFGLALCAGVGLLALGASGCLPSIEDLDNGPLTKTFPVSDYFTPSGFMGDGKYFGNLVGTTNVGCKQRPDNARGNCYSFTYYPNRVDEDAWAGVFWVFPANSWGSTYGHAIDMTKFKQVSFYAAIEGPMPYTVDGSPVPFNGLVGGIDPGNQFTINYSDGAKASTSAYVGTGVTSEWKQFHIALTDFNKGSGCILPDSEGKAENCMPAKDEMGNDIRIASDLIGAFGWSVHYPNESAKCLPPSDPTLPANWCQSGQHSSQFDKPAPVTVYLDDIVWEAAQ
jgi:hypothetical protein